MTKPKAISEAQQPGRIVSQLLRKLHCPNCAETGPRSLRHDLSRRTRPLACRACGFRFSVNLDDVVATLPADLPLSARRAIEAAVQGKRSKSSLTHADIKNLISGSGPLASFYGVDRPQNGVN